MEKMLETSPPSEPPKKLKVFLPKRDNLDEYLKKSLRFKGFKLENFDNIKEYLKKYFNIDITLLYIDQDAIDESDIENHDYIGVLTLKDDNLRHELDIFVKRGIPFILLKGNSEMECDVIKWDKKESECYKVRNGSKSHCQFNFYKELNFESPHTLIKIIKDSFKNINFIPVFSVAYLIDFFIWYAKFGRFLREKRDAYIEQKNKVSFATIIAASQEMDKKRTT